MPEKHWKKVERKVARILGCKRIPVGSLGKPDIESTFICGEVKSRKNLPQWQVEALRSAQAKAKPKQFPLVVLWEKGADDGILLCSVRGFASWFVK